MFRCFILSAVLSAVCCSTGFAYQVGSKGCAAFDEMEQDYIRDPDNIHNQLAYARCLVIKGKATGNRNDVTNGLSRLYHLADNLDNVAANYFLAYYLQSDGTFYEISDKNVQEAINYYLHTLALIELIPDYPFPNYFGWERGDHMELRSHYAVSILYWRKYDLGTLGDYYFRMLQSPSYEGKRDVKTYPEYNRFTWDSLEEILEHASRCTALPMKAHFDKRLYGGIKQACQLFIDMARILQPLERERLRIVVQPHCQDLNERDCPEFFEIDDEIIEVQKEATDNLRTVFEPICDLLCID